MKCQVPTALGPPVERKRGGSLRLQKLGISSEIWHCPGARAKGTLSHLEVGSLTLVLDVDSAQATGYIMRCYTHTDIQAVSICYVCGRALCRECLAEVKGRCCCKGRCEAAVKTPEERQAEAWDNPAFSDLQQMIGTFTKRTVRIAYVMPGLLLVSVGIALKLPPAAIGFAGYILMAIGALLLAWYYYLKLKNKWAARA